MREPNGTSEREKHIALREPLTKILFAPQKKGGIFRKDTKLKLAGRKTILHKNVFWSRMRNTIENVLLELELVFESANPHIGVTNVETLNEVLRKDTISHLEPLLISLFDHPILDEAKPDKDRAKVALLCVEYGMKYLRVKSGGDVRQIEPLLQILDEALGVCRLLYQGFEGESG